MKCIVCQSDETYWLATVMYNEDEGYEEYACKTCRSNFELGIKIVKPVYTGKNNVFPFEEE